jgi:hypothetical protein
VRILVLDQRAEGREVTNQVGDEYSPVLRFRGCYAQCYVRSGNWIAGGYK